MDPTMVRVAPVMQTVTTNAGCITAESVWHMIQVPAVLERCAGIDIGKKMVAVAVIVGPADREGEVETREFRTTVPQLEELREWLRQKGCTSVAMESTGPYWKPVKNVLEGHLQMLLVCPRKYQPPKGEKTDFRDARHLAHLHRHGLLTGSFLPSREIMELRDLTRRRKKLQSALSSEKNRIQKILETANVKIGNVVSDVFGVSGQDIISALLNTEPLQAGQMAEMAKARLRQRIPELTETLIDHQMTEHHRWLIRQCVDHAVFVDVQLEDLEKRIEEKLLPFQTQRELLETIPGVKGMTSATILAEIGPSMEPFASSKKLAQWVGICPGNNRSAGRKKSSHIRKANRFLLAALVQAAKAGARSMGTVLQRDYHRFVKKLGVAKASVAIAHQLLKTIYEVLWRGQPYRDERPAEAQERERQKQAKHHARRLQELGASEAVVKQVMEEIQSRSVETVVQSSVQPSEGGSEGNRETRTTPAKVCRGRLGFRARQTRPKKYSVVKHPPKSQPVHAEGQGDPKTNLKKPKENRVASKRRTAATSEKSSQTRESREPSGTTTPGSSTTPVASVADTEPSPPKKSVRKKRHEDSAKA
jgi:transposase